MAMSSFAYEFARRVKGTKSYTVKAWGAQIKCVGIPDQFTHTGLAQFVGAQATDVDIQLPKHGEEETGNAEVGGKGKITVAPVEGERFVMKLEPAELDPTYMAALAEDVKASRNSKPGKPSKGKGKDADTTTPTAEPATNGHTAASV